MSVKIPVDQQSVSLYMNIFRDRKGTQEPLITKSNKQTTVILSRVNTHVEEAVLVHVSEHVDDVSGTEGQLSLNPVMKNRADKLAKTTAGRECNDRK